MNYFYILRVIRIVILLLTCGFIHVSAGVLAQSITLKAEKMPFPEVIGAIRAQTGYQVSGPASVMRSAQPVDVDAKAMGLEDFLTRICQGRPFGFVLGNQNIVFYEQGSETPPAKDAPAQQSVVGWVSDEAGNRMLAANISVSRPAFGIVARTLSDGNGHFAVSAFAGDTLKVSYLGYRVYVHVVSATDSQLDIVLFPVVSDIAEVSVVSTGYQTLSRERVAGSFGTVLEPVLAKRSNFNILQSLEGQTPGVLMAADGSVTIRGRSTISADRNPLVVLDGFPIERSLSTINPADVESITVLKDASAASIWGVRAANGVIVVQTKRGSHARKPLDVNFSSTLSLTLAPDLSELPFARPEAFMEVEKHRVQHGMAYLIGTPRPAISPVVDAYLHRPDEADALAAALADEDAYREFGRLFMQPATRQQYALSLAGYGEKASYRSSFSYDRLGAEFKRNGTDRLVADLFTVNSMSSALKLELGLNAVYGKYDNNGMSYGDLRDLLPYQRILDDDGAYVPQPHTIYQADKEAFVRNGYPYDWDYNLKREFDNRDNRSRSLDLNATAALNYTLRKGLAANVAYLYERNDSRQQNLLNEETYGVRHMVNFSTANIGGSLVSGVPMGSIYRERFSTRYAHTLKGLLRYDGELGSPLHQLAAIAGAEVREVGLRGSNQTKYGYDPQSLEFARVDYTNRYVTVRGGQALIPDDTQFIEDLNRFVSVYANAGYTFRKRYNLNASARLDQTNLFGSSDKYRNVWLWSSGASWLAHEADFMAGSVFDRLVVRATYGINGNVDRSTSPFLVAVVDTDWLSNLPYAYVANPQNPLLRWERTAVTNLGVDFSLLKGRLHGSVEHYRRVSEDLLGNATVNGTYGFDNAFINYASMKNTGWDTRLVGVPVDGAVRWVTTLNYSYNKNEVTHVDFPQETVGAYLNGTPKAGRPLDYFYGYRWAGLDDSGAPQVLDGAGQAVGNTTEMVDPMALAYLGTGIAPHYGALINEVSYGRLSLLANLTYKFGHLFREPVIQYEPLLAGSNQVSRDWERRWQRPGDELTTDIPAAPTSVSGLAIYDRYAQYADIRALTASHIRLRELLVNYRLPSKWLPRSGNPTVNVGIQVRNLATFRFNQSDLDPEFLVYETVRERNSFALSPRPEFSLMVRANF